MDDNNPPHLKKYSLEIQFRNTLWKYKEEIDLELQLMTIHLLSLKGEELGDVEAQSDDEADKDVKQEVSPPL